MNDDIIISAIAVFIQQLYVVSGAGTEQPILRPNVQTYLNSDSLIRQMVAQIDEEDWQEIEVIGWLYQFYISEKKDQVIGKVVKSEDTVARTKSRARMARSFPDARMIFPLREMSAYGYKRTSRGGALNVRFWL